jgi:hypothetical protein
MGFRGRRNIDEGLTRRRDSTIEEDLIEGTRGTRPSEERDLLTRFPFLEEGAARRRGGERDPDEGRIDFRLPPREKFRREIGEQIGESQRALDEGARERGAFGEGIRELQLESGIKIGGAVVAEKEFADAISAEKDAVEYLARRSGITNQVRLNQFKTQQLKRLQSARKEVIRLANEAALRLEKEKMSAEKRRRTAKLMGTVFGTAIGAYFGPAGAMVGGSIGGAVGGAAGGGSSRGKVSGYSGNEFAPAQREAAPESFRIRDE